MKLLAHSLIPPTPAPYLHLGYTAAMTNKLPLADAGVLFSFSVLCIGLFLVLASRRNRRLIPVGLVTILCGTIALALTWRFLFNSDHMVYQYPDRVTESRLEALQYTVDYRQISGHAIPTDLTELHAVLPIILPSYPQIDKQVLEDGWMHPIIIRQSTEDKLTRYELVSAGPDGKIGSRDDIVRMARENMAEYSLSPEEQAKLRKAGSEKREEAVK